MTVSRTRAHSPYMEFAKLGPRSGEAEKTSRTHARSPYGEFANLDTGVKYSLGSSGVVNYPLSGLPVRLEDLELTGTPGYGYAPLLERIARYNGVTPDRVVLAAGTSMANHLAMAVTLEPGDEVLSETPTYELMVTAAEYLGATVRFFRRPMSEGFRIDPAEVERQMTERTRLIMITNLHNPTSVMVDDDTLREIGEIARKHRAYVLVDEVYLEALYEKRPRSAVHLGDQFLVTSSLTKAFGLSGLRCGWVLANPELTHRMWRINDLYGVNAAHPAELLSVIAFDNLPRVAAKAEELLATNRRALEAFLQNRDDLDYVLSPHGTTIFPRPRFCTVDDLDRRLREKYDASVVPGKFFYMPENFRLGISGPVDTTAEGLKRLGLALDELRS